MCMCVCVCLSVFVCVFVHVPCKRKPYMTQLSEPKRLCNYESFYASVCTCACVCVCALELEFATKRKGCHSGEVVSVCVYCCCSQCCCWSCRLQTAARAPPTESKLEQSTDTHAATHTNTHRCARAREKCIKPNRWPTTKALPTAQNPIGTEIKCQNTWRKMLNKTRATAINEKATNPHFISMQPCKSQQQNRQHNKERGNNIGKRAIKVAAAATLRMPLIV